MSVDPPSESGGMGQRAAAEASGPPSLELQTGPSIDGGLARFEHESLEVLVLDLELPEPELEELTESEQAVALLVLDGGTNAEIAEARGVSVRTVANQLRSLFQKLGVYSRWDLTLLMTRRSLQAQAAAAPEARAPADADESEVVHNAPETVQVLRRAYERFGGDFQAALREHDVMFREDGAIPRSAYVALFDALEQRVGVDGIGFQIARHLPRGTLGLIEWVTFSCATLGEAFAAASTYGELLHPGADRQTVVDEDRITIRYDPKGLRALPFLLDLSFGYTALRFIAAGASPIEVHMPHPNPGHGAAEAFYGCPVVYESDACRLVFPRSLEDVALDDHDPEVFELFRTLARLQAGKLAEHPEVYEAWAAITHALRSYETPLLATVARALGTSERTLQRRLGAAALSFSGLVSAACLQRALVALRKEERPATVAVDAAVARALERVAGQPVFQEQSEGSSGG